MMTQSAAGVLVVNALARFGQALSDPTRAQILRLLGDGPAYPAVLADQLCVSRQTVSNHLACLRGCGLVVAVPEGRRQRYELSDARIGAAVSALADVVLVVDPQCRPTVQPQRHRDSTVTEPTPESLRQRP